MCVCVSVTKDAKVYSPVKGMQLKLYKATRDKAFPPLLLLTMVNTSAEGLSVCGSTSQGSEHREKDLVIK